MKKSIMLFSLLSLTACQPSVSKQKVEGFFITSLQAPIGWQIKESKGFYCRFFEYTGTNDYSARFSSVLNDVAAEGKRKNANAFVNARVSSESHGAQGANKAASIIHVCGDYVVME